MTSQLIETSKGPIEYAILGQGPAVLVIHGCSGGYDQGLMAARLVHGHGFQFIVLSRPGYLRTPLRVGATPEAQADAYAALLDALEISQAAIIGISAGGPSALQFASRHPERCWALATLSAISKCLSRSELAKCKSHLRRSLLILGLAYNLAKNLAFVTTQKWRDLWLSKNPRNKKYEFQALNQQMNLHLFLGLLRSFRMTSSQKDGLQNDMNQLLTMPTYPLADITAPTLVLHGCADRLVSLKHAKWIANTVSNAKLIAVEGGGHLFFTTHKHQVVSAIIKFLNHYARSIQCDSKDLKNAIALETVSEFPSSVLN
ncbi:MAG: alpha/beta hydrolase [Deltaproteobacteria bacterium]|nr:alpha/beta hydrolase [Deltaproteobacteria bacterium]